MSLFWQGILIFNKHPYDPLLSYCDVNGELHQQQILEQIVSLPPLHCWPTNLPRLYHSHLCRQLSWPLTLIRPLPPTNYKSAFLLYSIGLPNSDWKPIALNPPMSPLPLVKQHVPGSTSTTSNFPKQKKLSILGYTRTGASPGISTSLPNRNILASHSPKCTGCWAVSPISL
jgi:hypothetical protein